MAVAFVAVGSIAVNSVDAFVDVVAPSCSINDILICQLLGKSNTNTHSAPDGTWTAIAAQTESGSAFSTSMWWKRAVSGSSGATFRFTKATDDNLFFAGVLSAWSGCKTSDSPLDATTPSQRQTGTPADSISYNPFDPTSTDCLVLACGFYPDDLTTAGAMVDATLTFTNRYDLETSTGTDCSFFCYSAPSNGAATSAGVFSHPTSSMADAINAGWCFALVPPSSGGAIGGSMMGICPMI